MPSVAITAINTTTEVLTATAHGMLTGQRMRLRNVGGALPASTPAIDGNTEYFAIRVDDNSFKIAVSSSDAQAGTAVNLTGSLSGSNFVEYGLPYCVPRIAAAATQVFSDDDNKQWQALVALYRLLTGQPESVWSGAVTLAGALAVAGTTTLNGTLNGPIISNVITPAIVTGNNNDFAPTGFANAITVLFAGSGSPVITGMAGGVHGRMVYLINAGGVTTTITHEDTNSTAANRFLSPTAATITLTSNQGTMWMYDSAPSRWRLMSKNF